MIYGRELNEKISGRMYYCQKVNNINLMKASSVTDLNRVYKEKGHFHIQEEMTMKTIKEIQNELALKERRVSYWERWRTVPKIRDLVDQTCLPSV